MYGRGWSGLSLEARLKHFMAFTASPDWLMSSPVQSRRYRFSGYFTIPSCRVRRAMSGAEGLQRNRATPDDRGREGDRERDRNKREERRQWEMKGLRGGCEGRGV